MWEIQARYSDYALKMIRESKHACDETCDPPCYVKKDGLFYQWTSVSDIGELEDVIEKYSTVRKDVNLYQYRLHNCMTDEAIPCEIL